jgi:hypothetical protein
MILGRELSRIRHMLHALPNLEANYECNHYHYLCLGRLSPFSSRCELAISGQRYGLDGSLTLQSKLTMNELGDMIQSVASNRGLVCVTISVPRNLTTINLGQSHFLLLILIFLLLWRPLFISA